MRLVVQRVKSAKVRVDDRSVAEIGSGLLLLVGIGKEDRPDEIQRLARKVLNLRIFEDDQGKMNLNVIQVKGGILSVPQFTLYADTSRGNRPGFELSAKPDMAKAYWEKFNESLKEGGIEVKAGIFGKHMEVGLINDGPVTILL